REKSSPGAGNRGRGASSPARFSCACSLVAPNRLQVGDASFRLLGRKGRAEFKHLEVFGFDHWLQRGKIDGPGAGRSMIASREFDVVNMETVKSIGQRLEMHGMVNETEVLFDLGVPGVVPVNH